MIALSRICAFVTAVLAVGPALGEESPRETLERFLREPAQRGSIFTQAKLDGLDYRPVLRKAVAGQERALVELFEFGVKGRFMGEASISHETILRALLDHLGDDLFSKALAKAGEPARWSVRWRLDESFGKAGYATLHPKTFKLAQAARKPDE
ncbi:MAG TPA: hypothetical protein VGO11_10665 [Chthoniobacteraceae bacterium]|jgi:hypothetical protein|nr:hypothetical protein [Chthoniobacteraceae bacterium]